MPVQIQIRNGTAAQWTAANPTLAAGEVGIETDTKKQKFGDGTTAWNSLGYAGSTGTVSSVGMSVPAFLSVTGSPVTSSGTLAVTLSGTALPVANGGTGQTSTTAAFDALAPSQTSNSGKYLTTNGTTTSWATVSGGGSPAGSDTQVQYNSGGTSFGASSAFTFASGTGVVTATGFSGAVNGTVGATTPAAGTFTTATARAAATQDSVVLQGRAGGTNSYAVTITPTTLTGNKTLTLPDATGTILQSGTAVTVAQGGTGLTAGTSGGIPYYSGASAITSSAALTQYGIVYGGGAGGAPVSTAAGTTGQFLGANTGAAPTWQSVSGGSAATPTALGTVYGITPSGTAAVAVGYQAATTTTSAVGVTAVGYQALTANTGTLNTAVGYSAGSLITSGTKNTIIGGYNGNQSSVDIRTASNNIVISDGDGNPRLWCNSSAAFVIPTGRITVNAATFTSGAQGYIEVEGDSALVRNLFASNNTAAGSASAGVYAFKRNGTYTGGISQTDVSTAYNTSSDYRLKENVLPISGALEKLKLLKPVSYNWKSSGIQSEGFIAHELAEVFPEAVSGEKDAVYEDGSIKPQGIDTSFLVATLTAALQELSAVNEALTARIAALEAK